MPYVNSPHDGARLYYVDYRPAKTPPPFQPAEDRSKYENMDLSIVFVHGFPMSGKMFEHLQLKLCESYGVRSIASDRRGFGKSEWSGTQNAGDITYEVFAADTLAIIKSVPDLGNFVIVAASMGAGESILVHELMKKEGLDTQCKGLIWIGPSLPHPLSTPNNPNMPSRELWDSIMAGFRQDRTAFIRQSIGGVFGVPSGIEMSEGGLEFFIDIAKQADAIAIERCVQTITNYDFTEKLKNFQGHRLLILHGDKDLGE